MLDQMFDAVFRDAIAPSVELTLNEQSRAERDFVESSAIAQTANEK